VPGAQSMLIADSGLSDGSCRMNSSSAAQVYASHFRMPNGMPFVSAGGTKVPPGAPTLVPPTELIEELRPRSPGPGH